MGDNFLTDSDSMRSGKPLKHAMTVAFDEPLDLELGGRLPHVTVAYETLGRLNEARDNAVLICHAISGDSHVARHDEQDDPGWWDIVVGPGKSIDTDEFFVVCPNLLGGCRGTTGPNSINPETNRPYGQDFPRITIGDMVQVHRRLIDHLGIGVLHAAVGGSMGGHQVICLAGNFPDRVRGAVALATSPRLTSQAVAFDVVGRNAIFRDPNFRGGQYYNGGEGPDVGLAIARMIGHITYLSRQAMQEKFDATRNEPRDVSTAFEKNFSVGSYLGYQGDKFVERFDANSYITLSMAMDMFDLGETPQELADSLGPSRCRWLLVSFTSDWLFPPEQSQELVRALIARNKPVSYCNVRSPCGHDAFLLPNELESYGQLLRAFLRRLKGRGRPQTDEEPCLPAAGRQAQGHDGSPTSIFQSHRLDYDRIIQLIPPGSGVLDLGCGGGELLTRLRHRGHDHLVGVELDEKAILACVRRGLDVIHADLNDGLAPFSDGQFDFVVLSQTLQAVMDVEGIMAEMLRVGRRCVVSFPNFAYHKLREMLVERGRAPVTSGLLPYEWYNTPNIRFLSIADFEQFCADEGIKVHKRVTLDTEADCDVTDDPNRNADLAIYVVSR